MWQMRYFVETDIHYGLSIFGHILKDFMENIPRWGISQLGISLVSSDLVFFSINYVNLLWQMIPIVETDVFM